MHSQYNILPFNTMQYNVTDAIDLTFSELMVMVEVRTNMLSKPLADAEILVDSITKSITEKRLTDAVTTNDWFTVKNAPQSDPWA